MMEPEERRLLLAVANDTIAYKRGSHPARLEITPLIEAVAKIPAAVAGRQGMRAVTEAMQPAMVPCPECGEPCHPHWFWCPMCGENIAPKLPDAAATYLALARPEKTATQALEEMRALSPQEFAATRRGPVRCGRPTCTCQGGETCLIQPYGTSLAAEACRELADHYAADAAAELAEEREQRTRLWPALSLTGLAAVLSGATILVTLWAIT